MQSQDRLSSGNIKISRLGNCISNACPSGYVRVNVPLTGLSTNSLFSPPAVPFCDWLYSITALLVRQVIVYQHEEAKLETPCRALLSA